MWRSATLCLLLLALVGGLRPARRRGPPGRLSLLERRRAGLRTTTAAPEGGPTPDPAADPTTTTTTTTAAATTTTTAATTRRTTRITTTAEPALLPGVDYETECPEKYGFFADAFQCDRYYECHNFRITEHLCDDGLVFNDFSTTYGRCDFMHSVNCTGREELQDPKPAGLCPRQNGYYPDRNPAVCDKFVQCTKGKANPLTCPAGLLFSLKTSTCQWPDQAGRSCNSEEYLDFQCPGDKVDSPAPGQLLHPRFADPKDCQFFFSCLDGVVPRRHGCEQGRVFNDATKKCDEPENVPECKDWYKG